MDLLIIINFTGLVLFAYLFGSIPWGLVLTRRFSSVDIRKAGSGNIGATNVRRTAGTMLGILTLTGDLVKGALPVWISVKMTGGYPDFWGEAYVAIVSLSSFFGHLYPVYLKFKTGGKGVATAAGCFMSISPGAVIIAVFVFICVAALMNRVSAGSLAASAVLPLAVWWATYAMIITACSVVMAVFIYMRHKDNIRRLISGTEPVMRHKIK